MKNLKNSWVIALALQGGVFYSLIAGAGTDAVLITWDALYQQTDCEGDAPSFCLGRYGFQVHSDGHYQVGPAPNGDQLNGTLSAKEFDHLKPWAYRVAQEIYRFRCVSAPYEPGGVEIIRMKIHNSAKVTALHWNGTSAIVCYAGEKEDAFQMETVLDQLLKEYYPSPFPT